MRQLRIATAMCALVLATSCTTQSNAPAPNAPKGFVHSRNTISSDGTHFRVTSVDPDSGNSKQFTIPINSLSKGVSIYRLRILDTLFSENADCSSPVDGSAFTATAKTYACVMVITGNKVVWSPKAAMGTYVPGTEYTSPLCTNGQILFDRRDGSSTTCGAATEVAILYFSTAHPNGTPSTQNAFYPASSVGGGALTGLRLANPPSLSTANLRSKILFSSFRVTVDANGKLSGFPDIEFLP